MRGFRILAVALLAGCSSSPSTDTARTGPQPEPEKPAAADGAEPAPSDIPIALVTLYEWNPWADVIGADSPRLVVYRDGTAIFQTFLKDQESRFMSARLSGDDLAAFQTRLGPTKEFSALKEFYDLKPNATDQPEIEIQLEGRSVRVRGLLPEWYQQPGETHFPGGARPDALPAEFDRLYRFLVSLDPPGAVEWTPDWIEVMIWSFDYAPEQTLAWPDGWPGTDSPLAKQRHEDAWSLFLPGERLKDLKALLEKRASNQAIRISGKKWSADWRPVYPGDDRWKRIRELTR